MRIAVVGLNYFPERVGIGVYTHDMCRFFVSAGHQVEVVAAFPFYPEMRLSPADKGRWFRTDRIDGVVVHRCYVHVRGHSGGAATRILPELSFALSATVRLLTLRTPQVQVVVSPPFVEAVIATLLARARRIPAVVHLQDLQADAAGELGLMPDGPFLRAARRAEHMLLTHASLVSTLDDAMRARLIQKGALVDKVVLFPNWVDRSNPPAPGESERFRAEHGLTGKLLVVYSGSMGVKHGLDSLIRVAARAEKPDVHFVFIGDGAVRPVLEADAHRLQLSNVTFLPLQPVERFAAVLAASDLSIIPQRPEVRDLVVPSKVLRIMAAGSPVVAATHPESGLARIVRESGGGVTAPAEDPAAIWAAISALQIDPNRRAEMGRRGKQYVAEHFDRHAVLSRYLARLQDLVARCGESNHDGVSGSVRV